jgi:AraC-like DNA-binding protein
MKPAFPIFDIGNLSEFNRKDILISRFAPYLKIHQNLLVPHKHSFYHLVLFTKGAGSHAIDFQNYPVKPFQIYFMIPGQVHSWNFTGPVDGYVINFSEEFFKSFLLQADYLEQFPFFSGSATEAIIDLPPHLQPMVLDIGEKLIAECQAHQRLGLDMVRTLLLQLFIIAGRLSFEQPTLAVTAYNYTLLRKYQKLVDQNYTTLRLPKEYAALLFITPNHLNNICKEVLGQPAGEVIRDRIMLEAKRLLTNLKLTISEVAYALQFSDNSYFTKFFKKHAGLTPEKFRENLLHPMQHEGITLG